MSKLPIVALIGQTNAGKSSLLNRLARKNIAIVAREEGTTRDNVMATIDDSFILIDTAGLKDPTDDFEASIQDQIADAIDAADVILVTLDSAKYFDHKDAKIAKSALRSGKPVYLVLNKCDLGSSLPITEFRALGIAPENIYYTSATTGQGTTDLKRSLESIFSGDGSLRPVVTGEAPSLSAVAYESPRKKDSKTSLKIALIGRPNVGKSSLFNSLGKKQQAIVSSRQGTTRDINRVQIKYKGRDLEILDTAGLRRPGKREVGIEKFSAIRTLAAIEEADICALLVDGTEPHAKLDQTLAGQIIEAGKGIIVVVTKTDLVQAKLDQFAEEKSAREEELDEDGRKPELTIPQPKDIDGILDDLERDFNFLPYAPVLLTSSETGKNVTKLFELALEIDENRHTEVKTSELNKILNDAIASHIPAGLKNTRPKPKYIVQTDVCPPWFVVHGHNLELLHWSWKRFLERKIREKYPFVGTPIMFSFRNDSK
ncbi:MAG: 50S ribosome-binding GTPase [Candidatus Saccharibacteria bacterium]|nr:50S ribosome-binding GTPase [Candidatus Saccharibacteria bacterium]